MASSSHTIEQDENFRGLRVFYKEEYLLLEDDRPEGGAIFMSKNQAEQLAKIIENWKLAQKD